MTTRIESCVLLSGETAPSLAPPAPHCCILDVCAPPLASSSHHDGNFPSTILVILWLCVIIQQRLLSTIMCQFPHVMMAAVFVSRHQHHNRQHDAQQRIFPHSTRSYVFLPISLSNKVPTRSNSNSLLIPMYHYPNLLSFFACNRHGAQERERAHVVLIKGATFNWLALHAFTANTMNWISIHPVHQVVHSCCAWLSMHLIN